MSEVDPWLGPYHLPEPREEYIAWIDMMGTGRIMEWSPQVGTINVGKLIIAAIEAQKFDGMQFYPVMDGIYFTHHERAELNATFKDIFIRFARVLTERYDDDGKAGVHFSPILRAGISYGKVYHGTDFKDTKISGHEFSDYLLSGTPVAEAHFAEQNAPPFGYEITGSATDNGEKELVKWWQAENFGDEMREALHSYFDYFKNRKSPEYPDKKIAEHRSQVDEYFSSF